jgi:penicillin-binding protein 1C
MGVQRYKKQVILWAAPISFAAIVLAVATIGAVKPVPTDFASLCGDLRKRQFTDRRGRTLNRTYQNPWNIYDRVSLHEVPEFLQRAFIVSEDKRFYNHHGVDWLARLSALKQGIAAGRVTRGASTISEQAVRLIHKRPRTLWSRWLEGFEAKKLESQNSKADILEFYLNQVPYQSRRRGIRQAASHYFDRHLWTLSQKEMLALVVFVRSPKWFDPQRFSKKLDAAILRLAERMVEDTSLTAYELAALRQEPIRVKRPSLALNAEHFIRYIRRQALPGSEYVHTTLDADLQRRVQQVLDTRLDTLQPAHVANGAVLIVDHGTNEIIAWVVGRAGGKQRTRDNELDPIVTPRQPGSTLKPFVYALAMEKGWTASTLVNDTPLEEGVGTGLHVYRNYSRRHYGPVSVREALGNSLNIPAVHAIQYVGAKDFLAFLYRLGMYSLAAHPDVYGDGIALGNGEVTLFELVQAYSTLARMGDFKPLTGYQGQAIQRNNRLVLNAPAASLIADILSDPRAREKEFGRNSILNLPYPTAVKTGTSNDYRDAWSVGFNDRYTVGVWMGNLDYRPMHEVTGSTGPAVVLRTIFNDLNRGRVIKPLYRSPLLEKHRVCIETGLSAKDDTKARDEWFLPGSYPVQDKGLRHPGPIRIRKPTPNLHLAMDPRIPDEYEAFQFEITRMDRLKKVEWYINGRHAGTGRDYRYRWPLEKGRFKTYAKVWLENASTPVRTPPVAYRVK